MKEISRLCSNIPVSTALEIDLKAKELAANGQNIINFSVGEPDFPTPPVICDAGILAIKSKDTKYTNASGKTGLKCKVADCISKRYGISYSEKEIALTSGAKYAIYAALMAVINPGDKVLLPAPYWTSYIQIIKLVGAQPVVLQTSIKNGFKINGEMIRKNADAGTKAIILNNPNNPSGAVYTKEELEDIEKAVSETDLYVVSDEIYDRILFSDEKFVSFPSLNQDAKERTILVNGFSKTFAMTGWRLGYVCADSHIISNIQRVLSHTTGAPSTISQDAAMAALDMGDELIDEMASTYKERRDMLATGLSNLPGLEFAVPEGAFYLMLCLNDKGQLVFKDGKEFAMNLLYEEGVAVVPCSDYGYPKAVRISFSVSNNEISDGIERIKSFAQKYFR